MLCKPHFVLGALLLFILAPAQMVHAKPAAINARSAILIDMTTGDVLYEQDADTPIAPASVTKILTLYIVKEAVRDGKLHLWDEVRVSRKAARTGGSRMGLRAGTLVTVEELIKGMAVVSGNDACVAMAEHLSGTVDGFVEEMNRKARELGMTRTVFKTPNGLPAKGQLTTARDMAKLSMAYLRRFPDSLTVHSMRSYTYNRATHKNANRLLGRCPGVDGIKTGFVCASGYNLSATAKRGDHRLIAVVMGAPTPSVRACETSRLLEDGFAKVDPELAGMRYAQSPEGRSGMLSEEGSCSLPKRGRKYRTKAVSRKESLALGVNARGSAPGTAEAAGVTKRPRHAAAVEGSSSSESRSTMKAGMETRKPGIGKRPRSGSWSRKIGSDGENAVVSNKKKGTASPKVAVSEQKGSAKTTVSKSNTREVRSAVSGRKASNASCAVQHKKSEPSARRTVSGRKSEQRAHDLSHKKGRPL